MFAWISLGIALVFPTVQLAFFSKDRSPSNIGRVYLCWLLPLSVGFGGFWAFIGHTLKSDDVARSIGWPVGNPFQLEVAVANLAFGVLGVLCLKFRDHFWTATIVGYGIFLEGAGMVHIHEIVKSGNWSINNAGPILFADILMPLLLLLLLVLSKSGRQAEPN
jgi:hypothetical protein